ncbi:1-aminocyclopropane-1-carboxylate deaminase/D-cysteine desulfhydrase [Pedobacter alpinus]|uniref:1-aminocyclopropane-1-carboxylate deaminase/D-cysteine desulfhydrase n=1 Tax=Pedobacter alpinus TaxID=1590643 RepID=A0ABW5TS74_9SPHI
MIDLKFYSPEEEVIYEPINKYNVQLYLKRDDLIHPFISGNKWRKLKYNLIKAKNENKKHLVTFGGAYSNHLLATAAAGAKFKFKTTAFVRGDLVENPVLDFCKIFGMELFFVSREDYKDKDKLFNQKFKHSTDFYLINEGGYGMEAELGCREIISELETNYDYIFCAAGTGATAAGLINGKNLYNIMAEINIIATLKGADFLKTEINTLLTGNYEYNLHTNYHFGGYAKTKDDLIGFTKNFIQKTGILIDPVYTAKTLFAIQDLAAQNYFKPFAKILMIHTGGLFGLLGMPEKFR